MSGAEAPAESAAWDDLALDPVWRRVVAVLAPDADPRPVQAAALSELRLLEQRRNIIVSAPTNAGKSLVGLLALLEAVRRGQRAVLLEPLRAVAREKWDELQAARPAFEAALGCRIRVAISTGDYRLNGEHFSAPLPDHGELLIATPERLDAVLRDPKRDTWFARLGAVVVDEAHLVATPGRGATLEYLITSLLSLPAPPRVVLLSATVGDVTQARRWLDPCDVARVSQRIPPLAREVWELSDGEADAAVTEFARAALAEPDAQALVFVYQTRSAEALAARLGKGLGPAAGADGALAYHGQMSQALREEVRGAFRAGRCRMVVTTTALALGVNLPATHVCVRDIWFAGVGPLPVGDLLQMMGRAGRGSTPGRAVALVRPTDGVSADDLARAITEERLPELRSSLDATASPARVRGPAAEAGLDCAAVVLARLARHPDDGMAAQELRDFFARSLGGRGLAGRVGQALDWLTDPRRVLAFADERRRYRPTALGLRAARAALPLGVAAGYARLVRDLLALDPSDELLGEWQPLDHLLVLELTYPHTGLGTRFGERLAGKIDAWLRAESSCAPRLYRAWVAGPAGDSRAHQLLGSLSAGRGERLTPEAARKTAYLALFRSILLFERGQGALPADLERRWGVAGLMGVEERWRDDLLWLLAGVREILEVRCFYFHLKEVCQADSERVRRADVTLRRMRRQTFELQEQLKHGSPRGRAKPPVAGKSRRAQGPA
jgi:superfamily II DNA/RNA helicase